MNKWIKDEGNYVDNNLLLYAIQAMSVIVCANNDY